MIQDIGTWVVQESCRQLREWLDRGYQVPRMSLNVSCRELEDRNFAHVLNHVCGSYNIPINMIELEITESCLQQCDIGLHNLRRLKKLGARIAIDDFGTGYFSMGSLKALPITTLKLAPYFVHDIHIDSDDRAVANAIIAMAKQLGLRTIGEGIELQVQAQMLTDAGCDELQGYFFCVPLPVEQINGLLKNTAFHSLSERSA